MRPGERDVVTRELIRISGAVPALVMRQGDDLGQLAAAAPRCRRECARRSSVCVRITAISSVGQPRRFEQQRIWNADLADVVQ